MPYENFTAVLTGLFSAVTLISALIFRKRRRDILLLFVSTLSALLVAEAVLRCFYPQIHESPKLFEYDPIVGWHFIPNKRGAIAYPGEAHHYIQINSWGFRDRRVDSNILAMQKLLVLGDSFVSNFAVVDDDVFTEVMERQLAGTAVLNFGVNGYGPVQSYLLLRNWYDKVRPDLIIMVVYLRNDFKDNLGGVWRFPRPYVTIPADGQSLRIHPPPRVKLENRRFPSFRYLNTRIHLFNLVDRNLSHLMQRFSPDESVSQPFTPPELYLCRIDLTENVQLMYSVMEVILMEMNAYGNLRNTPVVFALAPSMMQVEKEKWTTMLSKFGLNPTQYDASQPNDKLMRFARKNHIRMVDLLPALQAETQKGNLLYHRKEQHWNREGNRVVAETLISYLHQQHLIKP